MELGGYFCVEAAWEGFRLSAAKAGKSSPESTYDDRKGGTMHGGRAYESDPLESSANWGILPDEENGYSLLLQSLPFWPNLHIKLVLHSRVSNEF